MKKLSILIIIIIIIVGSFLVLKPKAKKTEIPAQTKVINSSVENSSSNEVSISNYSYSPSKLTIKKGQSVKWTNYDSVKHDVMPDNQTSVFAASELLAKNESYTTTFDTVGLFSYHCTPHPYMKGTIEVTE